MNRININEPVLSKNEETAARLKERFKKQKTLVINLASSPGSGKTSLLEKLLPPLVTAFKIAVIEGDLRTENDAVRLRKAGVNAVQIQTGDACHLEAAQVEELLEKLPRDLDLIIIENIGNLVCPASYNLGEDYFFVMLSTAEGEDKPSKYPVIFRKADYFLINKIDLLPYVDFDMAKCRARALSENTKLEIIEFSARTEEGIEKLEALVRKLIEEKKR